MPTPTALQYLPGSRQRMLAAGLEQTNTPMAIGCWKWGIIYNYQMLLVECQLKYWNGEILDWLHRMGICFHITQWINMRARGKGGHTTITKPSTFAKESRRTDRFNTHPIKWGKYTKVTAPLFKLKLTQLICQECESAEKRQRRLFSSKRTPLLKS